MSEQLNCNKLPVFKIFAQTIIVLKERYRFFIKFSSPFIITLLMNYIAQVFSVTEQRSLYYLIVAVNFIFSSIVIVAFHRIFILEIKDIEQMDILRFESRELLFMGWFLLILIAGKIIFTILLIPLIGLMIHGDQHQINFVYSMILPLVFYFMSRLLLALPAASIENEKASINYAWSLSKGNGFRLTLLIFTLPAMRFFLFDTSFFINGLISFVLTLTIAILVIGNVSLSYSYLQKYYVN